MGAGDIERLVDFQIDWSGGVNSNKVPTIASEQYPTGLKQNQLAWLQNGTVRGGGIAQRTGWKPLCFSFTESATYYLVFAADWVIPVVGGTVVVTLTSNYAGSDGDTSKMFGYTAPDSAELIGTVEVISGAGTTTLTIKILVAGAASGTTVLGNQPSTPFSVTKPSQQTCSMPGSGLFQGASVYQPDFANPYLMVSIGGRMYKVEVDTNYTITDVTGVFADPPSEPQAFFAQAENFLVKQSGDLTTNPLIWDGTTLRRSNGFIAAANPGNEIPAAGPMDYWMGRLWYAKGRQYCAGDIVFSSNRASVLSCTENPLSLAGDAFVVPSNAGNIRALTHTAELDTALGQGRLYIGTREAWYRCNAPVTRADWIATTNLNLPLQTVAQINYGPVNDRSVVKVNGDLFHQSLEPAIRSVTLSTRFFNQWGNRDISSNEHRVLRFNDRSLMHFASGINFDNRLWQTVLPFQTPKGVAFKGIVPLDFNTISSLEEQAPPAWEGMYEGLQVLQLLVADFGGVRRAFAFIVSELTGNIDLWEFTLTDRGDQQVGNDWARVTWYFETPAYTFGTPKRLKELDGLELWIDKLLGDVVFTVEYRPDQHPCWYPWHVFKLCAAKDCREDPDFPICPTDYPQQLYCEQYRNPVRVPKPIPQCVPTASVKGRPSTIGYQFQVRLTIKGWARIRGLFVYARPRVQSAYENMVNC